MSSLESGSIARGLGTMVVGAVALSLAAMAVAAPSVGWRGDGTGQYPSAKPCTTWSADSNVVWSTPLPSWGNSTPVPVDGRLFFCVEPSALMCARASDGKILWQSTNNLEELASPEARPKIGGEQAQGTDLRKQLARAVAEKKKQRADLQDKPDDADLRAQMAATQQRIADLSKQVKAYNAAWYSLPVTHVTNGMTSATPVSDGQHIYAVFGTGMVVCYDLDGKCLWRRVLEKPVNIYGYAASPVLVGDKLLVHIRSVIALDKQTGKTLWQTRVPESWGTPVTTRIGDTELLITPAGDILRVADGKVLARSVAKLTYCSPVVEGDVVYFIEDGGKAIKLPAEVTSDSLSVETLWRAKIRKDRYYSSPVVSQGLVYACTQANVFTVLDAATGAVVYEQKLPLGKGTVFASVTLAGGLLFVSSDNGTTIVLKPGRQYQEVALNKLAPFRATPVFVGDRMYIHGLRKLYCIGPQPTP